MIYTPTDFMAGKSFYLQGAFPFPAIALTLSVAIVFMIFGWGRTQLGTISRAGLGAGAIGLAVYGGMGALAALST